MGEKLFALVKDHERAGSKYQDKFILKNKGRNIIIEIENVYFIEATGVYITINDTNGKYLYRTSMNAMEALLNPEIFLRIHRSYIINIQFLEKVKYLSNNKYLFILKNSINITSSRSYKATIAEFLSNSGI